MIQEPLSNLHKWLKRGFYIESIVYYLDCEPEAIMRHQREWLA